MKLLNECILSIRSRLLERKLREELWRQGMVKRDVKRSRLVFRSFILLGDTPNEAYEITLDYYKKFGTRRITHERG